ncbi:MAG: hypothetical protein H6733_00690 [Alphaproteobacteria bacterium]|nr:hypothetical protein [Alphaproteobacteria bacterium]
MASRPVVWTLIAVAALAGCSRATTDEGAGTDDADTVDTDTTPAGPACDGTFEVDLTAAPETFTAIPTTWDQAGAELRTEPFEQGGYTVRRDEAGCLVLGPGTLVLDLIHTGCVAASATVRVTDQCGPACTVLLAATDERVAENHTTRTDVEEELTVSPAQPFRYVVIGSSNARVCTVRVAQAPIPEALALDDTAALF